MNFNRDGGPRAGTIRAVQHASDRVGRFHALCGMGGALAILVVTLATTFYAWHRVRVSVVEQDTERFKDEVRRMIELLRANHRRHLDTLNPIRARLESAAEITDTVWRRTMVREPWNAAGSLEVGYAAAVFNARGNGGGDGGTEGANNAVTNRAAGAGVVGGVVQFAQSKLDNSRRPPGTDLAQEAAVRSALAQAAKVDHAVATRRVRLTAAGGGEKRQAVLVLLAVRGQAPASPVRGFLFLTYDPEELVNDPRLQMASSGVEMAIVPPLLPKPGLTPESEEPFTRRMLFTMPGVSWTLLFTAKPSFFFASERMLPRLVLGAGIILSLLLFRIGWVEAHRRVAAERAAALRAAMAERERTARELQEALTSEKELNRLKSSFVATVSHEFRTPLAVILISCDLLERHFEKLEPAQRREQLGTIGGAVRRMSALMEQVLLLSRVESGTMEFKPAALELGELLRRVCDEVAATTQARCPIEVSAEKLPTARADEGLLRIVLANLINNAVKYSAAGSAVTVAAERVGNDAWVRVRDRGIGIPAADMRHLFTPFHRAEHAVNIQGTGLGLAIVKRCVTLHGGEIQCESTAGQGTTFTVRLPVFATASAT